jgi:Uma2 family endonuclease
MTYEEFLAWVDEDTHAEWVDGEVFVFMPVKWNHVEIVAFLFHLLGYYATRSRIGRAFAAPAPLLLRGGRSMREPDVVVLTDANRGRLTSDGIVGKADLVVEVVSSDSVTRDRRDKLREYAEAGIPEYWIVEGREGRSGVMIFRLHEEGYYIEIAPDKDGLLRSQVLPGLWIDPSWLGAEPLPDPFALGDRMLEAAKAG